MSILIGIALNLYINFGIWPYEVKSKGGKERYTHWNAEFQRMARKDKKDFFTDQCKEIETKQ